MPRGKGSTLKQKRKWIARYPEFKAKLIAKGLSIENLDKALAKRVAERLLERI